MEHATNDLRSNTGQINAGQPQYSFPTNNKCFRDEVKAGG